MKMVEKRWKNIIEDVKKLSKPTYTRLERNPRHLMRLLEAQLRCNSQRIKFDYFLLVESLLHWLMTTATEICLLIEFLFWACIYPLTCEEWGQRKRAGFSTLMFMLFTKGSILCSFEFLWVFLHDLGRIFFLMILEIFGWLPRIEINLIFAFLYTFFCLIIFFVFSSSSIWHMGEERTLVCLFDFCKVPCFPFHYFVERLITSCEW